VGVRAEAGDVPSDELTSGARLDETEIPQLGRDDPVTLMYTSGTTGRPKGALSTNRAAIAKIWNMAFAASRDSLITGRQPGPAKQPASLSTDRRPAGVRGRAAVRLQVPRGAAARQRAAEDGYGQGGEERRARRGGGRRRGPRTGLVRVAQPLSRAMTSSPNSASVSGGAKSQNQV
jgi:acyl-CoA synthetase (AMP-forming)/AMP-acid ligase II